MTPHDWFVEHRLDFVTRTLEPRDEASFRDHIARCPECAAAVHALEQELAWMPIGVAPVEPRPGFRRQVVQRVLRERPRRWQRAIVPLAIAASLVVGLLGYLPEHGRAVHLAGQLAARGDELAALRDSLSIMHQAAEVLQASIPMDGHQGGMLVFADKVSHRWNIVVHGLPPAPAGQTYQFWFICSDGMVRGATITSDSTRPVFLTLGMPKEGGTVMGAALTMEPDANSSPRDSHGRMLAHLML